MVAEKLVNVSRGSCEESGIHNVPHISSSRSLHYLDSLPFHIATMSSIAGTNPVGSRQKYVLYIEFYAKCGSPLDEAISPPQISHMRGSGITRFCSGYPMET